MSAHGKMSTKLSPGIATLLASTSLVFGLVLGLLDPYSNELGTSPVLFPAPQGYPSMFLVVSYTALAVTYPITIAVFYIIGNKRRSGYIAGGDLVTIFGGALVGEILAQTILVLLSSSGVSSVYPLSFAAAPTESLNFLFIAFSGFALSSLSRADLSLAGRRRGLLVASLVALPFGAVGSFLDGSIALDRSLQGNILLLSGFDLLSVALIFLQLIAFYYLGRGYSISGRTFRYFGQLFLGLYIGSVVGVALSLGLFGQNSWALAPGTASLSYENGVVYQNVAPSLQVLLEALNPIRSLPILSFFAMALSRTASRARSLMSVDTGPAPPLPPSSEIR